MGKPQVTLTFAGDSTKLESAFDKVGASAKRMDDGVGNASRKMSESRGGFDAAAAGADQTYSKFDALESVGRGTGDTMSGLSEIMKGNVLQGSTDLAGGVAALADGFSGALLPALKAASKASLANAVQSVRTAASTLVHRGAMIASAVATRGMTVAQKAMNIAMRANPIGLIITALLLLGAGLILAYKRSATFRAVVQGAMKGVQTAFGWVTTAGGKVIDWFKTMPSKIGGFLKGVAGIITAPYRAAFQGIKDVWNNTVGGKGFSVPGWIPGVGGNEFRIPYFHQGGIVPGAPGTETLAMLQAGERVSTRNQQDGGGGVLVIKSGGSKLDDALVEILSKAIRLRGGNVQTVLGA